jgi:hypothetical protein
MQKQIEKLIKKAHDKMIRIKGKEYSPTALEIQNEINKSLTAVDWLVNQVNSDCLNSAFIRPELIEKAKEMQKQQSINDYKHGQNNGYMFSEKLGNIIDAEEYYNQTYNK